MDVLSFLHDYSIPYQLKGKNLSRGRIGLNCCWCGDTGYHAAITADGRIFTCWRCGWHPTDKTLQALSGLSPYEYRQAITAYTGEDSLYETLNKKTANATSIELPGKPGLLPHDRKYIKDRGFDPDELIEKYGLRSGGISGDFAWRIIIPIYYQGKLVSWQGRTTIDDPIRYKTLSTEKSVVDPKSILYNIDSCKNDYVFVVEGAFHAMRIQENVCATLGISTTQAQTRLLSNYHKVVLLFDSEVPAQQRAKKLAESIAALSNTDVRVVDLELPDKIDIANLSQKEWKNYEDLIRKETDI